MPQLSAIVITRNEAANIGDCLDSVAFCDERIVSDLGPHDALVMRNHGLLTCGATVQQAFNTMYQLELSCRSQVDAMAARTDLTKPGENVLAHTAHLYQPGTRRPYGVLEWPAMLRLLAATEKAFDYPPHWH